MWKSANIQGVHDAGFVVLADRMTEAKTTNEEIRLFYKERVSIEEDYARRLNKLALSSLGTQELGSLRAAIKAVQSETAAMAAAHASNAAQLRCDLEEPHTNHSNLLRERRKLVKGNRFAFEIVLTER